MLRRLSPLLIVVLLVLEAAFATGASASPRVPAQAGLGSLSPERIRPPAPVGAYRPDFVHQGQNNCAFASAVMLLDRWTHGDRRPSQDRLREASNVPSTEGVGMSELARAVERVTNIDVRWSPGGGDPLTWDRLMQRLARGGAAVVAGAYSRLPSHYTRWGRDYAALGPSLSGHAVYVERYERGRRGGRVWIMDPLASGAGYRGEWISSADLKRFAWRTRNGLVHALATPEPPPLAGYEFGTPAVTDAGQALAGKNVTIELPLTVRSGWSAPDNLALAVTWRPESLDPDPDAVAQAYIAEVAAAHAEQAEAEAAAVTQTDGSVETNEPAGLDFDEEGVASDPGASDAAIDLSAEDLATWRAAQAAADAAEADEPTGAETAGDQTAGDETTGAETDGAAAHEPASMVPVEALVELSPRGDRLVGTLRAPDAAGTYRVTVELRHRDGSRFTDPAAPPLEGFNLRLGGALDARYDDASAGSDLEQGSAATISMRVTNLGSADWRGEDAAELVATWQTAEGAWHAGTAVVELGSLESGRFEVDVIVPTDSDSGGITLELLTSEGIPLALFGVEPTTLAVGFTPPTGTDTEHAPQE